MTPPPQEEAPGPSVRQRTEVAACSENRAQVQRQLLRCRNLAPAKLKQLDCPPRAVEMLEEWLGQLERELPDPGRLAGQLAEADLGPKEFGEGWDRIEWIQHRAEALPETAVQYLQSVAGRPDADKLRLLYWAYLHYPLHDRYAELSKAVKTLLQCDWMDRLWQAQKIHQNAEASQNAVEVYSYDSFDLYGSCFGWLLRIYRTEDGIAAEIHQWTSDEDAMEPSLHEVGSGMDLADLLRGGEVDGIWEIDRAGYQQAAERVFDFESELGIDFLDALVHDYGVELGEIDRPDLLATWEKHVAQLEEEDERRAEEPVESNTRAATDAGITGSDRSKACAHSKDPIAETLSGMTIEPVDVSGLRQWRGQIEARRKAERYREARAFVIEFAQKNLQLPTGRHRVLSKGASGRGFWVDFP